MKAILPASEVCGEDFSGLVNIYSEYRSTPYVLPSIIYPLHRPCFSDVNDQISLAVGLTNRVKIFHFRGLLRVEKGLSQTQWDRTITRYKPGRRHLDKMD